MADMQAPARKCRKVVPAASQDKVRDRFEESLCVQSKHSPELLQFPLLSSFSVDELNVVRQSVRRFLDFDVYHHGGVATVCWERLLSQAYPPYGPREGMLFAPASGGEALQGVASHLHQGKTQNRCSELENALVLVILRVWRNRRTARFHSFGTSLIEYFAGSASLTFAHLERGFCNCSRLDKNYSDTHDCLSVDGLRLWLDELAFSSPRSLQWLGTQCSSWVILCRKQSRRRTSNGFWGDEARAFVRDGNTQMVISSLLFFLASVLDNEPVMEQPANSCMPRARPLSTVLRFLGARRTGTWLGAFGADSPKPLQLWHIHPAFANLRRKKPTMNSDHVALVMQMGRAFTGRRNALKQSQAYPSEFGVVVASCAEGAFEDIE